MGTIEQLLDEMDFIVETMGNLDVEDRQAWEDIIDTIDRNREAVRRYIETPLVVHKLQDKQLPR